ncbi:hypothetical protein [Streptomyces caatingaensis]|uniref:Uncharacterized protein n=1 Tax=Streptomyces caatingaensis TaxID=1678637 RepID=A0A0K9X819_9ACTN|nr:hypothetical protein [Streptomyces caatingaensis]KNB49221.1 hypothetical protein AC230_28330 [Streptomyces caatingaensis]
MALLNWRDAKHFDRFNDEPCVICGKPTPMRSDHGKPVHKVCAEAWLDAHTTAPTDGRNR